MSFFRNEQIQNAYKTVKIPNKAKITSKNSENHKDLSPWDEEDEAHPLGLRSVKPYLEKQSPSQYIFFKKKTFIRRIITKIGEKTE